MKKLTLLIVFIPLITISQSWQHLAADNVFDGKILISSIHGTGTNSPYIKPLLTVSKIENDGGINFYITNAGNFQQETTKAIYWVFDSEPEVIYSTYNYLHSKNGKILFFEEFNNPRTNGKLSKFEIIEKLKSNKKVSVRISDINGSNDLTFSLIESTNSINKVITQEEMQKIINEIVIKRDEQNKVTDALTLLLNKLLDSAKSEGIDKSSLQSLEFRIKGDFGLSMGKPKALEIEKGYHSISTDLLFDPNPEYMLNQHGYVSAYYLFEDGTKKQIPGSYKVIKDAPIYDRLEKEKQETIKKLEYEKNRIMETILNKYEGSELKSDILNEILKQEKYSFNDWTLSDIRDVKLKIISYSHGEIRVNFNGFKDVSMSIFFKGNYLNRKYLKQSKMKLGETF